MNAIALPKVEVGDLTLKATATAGGLKVDQLSAAGKDLDLQGDGSVRLRDTFDASVLSMNARFKFNERFTNKDELTRSLFGAPGSSVPALFDMVPQNKHAKRPDGFYGWRVNGTFSRPTFVPSASTGAAAVGGATLSYCATVLRAGPSARRSSEGTVSKARRRIAAYRGWRLDRGADAACSR